MASYEPKGSLKEDSLHYNTHRSRGNIKLGTGSTLSMDDVRAKWAKEEKKKQSRSMAGTVAAIARQKRRLQKQKEIYLRYLQLLKEHNGQSGIVMELVVQEFGCKWQYANKALSEGLTHKWHKEVPNDD